MIFFYFCALGNPKHHHYLDYYMYNGLQSIFSINETLYWKSGLKCRPHRYCWIKLSNISSMKDMAFDQISKH